MFFKAIKLILTLRCEESERLLSEGLDGELTFVERMAVAGHQLSCRQCRYFLRQLKFLRQAIRRREADILQASGLSAEGLSTEARQRIQAAITGVSREEPE